MRESGHTSDYLLPRSLSNGDGSQAETKVVPVFGRIPDLSKMGILFGKCLKKKNKE
jgi:hypothetical protein